MTFYSKLSIEIKRQFQTSDITIPETRAQCVSVAQRVWEGLYSPEKRRDTRPYQEPRRDSGSHQNRDQPVTSKYPRPDSRRDRKDRYRTSHRKNEHAERLQEKQSIVTCFNCQEPGHYATACPRRKDQKDRHQKAKVQSAQRAQSTASSRRSTSPDSDSSRITSEEPQNLSEPDSDDSLN